MPTNSTDPGATSAATPLPPATLGKRLFFYLILLSPLIVLIGSVAYLALGTSVKQEVYIASWRNLDLPCQQWTDQGFGYKGKPGDCRLNNPEYQTVITFDQEGFRNLDTRAPADVILLGDSHTMGFGVNDQETFSSQLNSRHHLRTKNLGISSYATFRELEAMKAYAGDAKVVILQYCDNDADENEKALILGGDEFLPQVKARWTRAKGRYENRKARGPMGTVSDFAHALMDGKFVSMAEYRNKYTLRNLSWEADNFSKIIAKYRPQLEGKTVIVFESSGNGYNHPEFKSTFESALAKQVPGMRISVLDSHALLTSADYYRIDDHLNARGHAHLADILQPLIARSLGPGGA